MFARAMSIIRKQMSIIFQLAFPYSKLAFDKTFNAFSQHSLFSWSTAVVWVQTPHCSLRCSAFKLEMLHILLSYFVFSSFTILPFFLFSVLVFLALSGVPPSSINLSQCISAALLSNRILMTWDNDLISFHSRLRSSRGPCFISSLRFCIILNCPFMDSVLKCPFMNSVLNCPFMNSVNQPYLDVCFWGSFLGPHGREIPRVWSSWPRSLNLFHRFSSPIPGSIVTHFLTKTQTSLSRFLYQDWFTSWYMSAGSTVTWLIVWYRSLCFRIVHRRGTCWCSLNRVTLTRRMMSGILPRFRISPTH